MADEAKKPGPTAPSGAVDKELLPQDKDVLFQAQMAVANAFLGYYKYGLGLIGVVLVGALIYGAADTIRTNGQKDVHAKIAAVQNDLTDPNDKAALGKAATELETIATKGDGTAAVMALLQAAEVFRAADQGDDALRAYEKAYGLKGEGILGWSAAAGLAAEKTRKGDVDGAIAIYQQYKAGDGIEAEESLWGLAVLFEDAGKKDEARQALTDLTTRFPNTPHLDAAGRALQRLGS